MNWKNLGDGKWAAQLNLGDTTLRLGVELGTSAAGPEWAWWVDGGRRRADVHGTADDLEEAQRRAEAFAGAIVAHTPKAPRAALRVRRVKQGEHVHA